jgi:Dyp-type peroxidase family
MSTRQDGTKIPTPKEHFGFTDGIGDPTFAGQYESGLEAAEVIGAGKLNAGNPDWTPLATGEFILGHASEAQELPPSARPWSFMRNGTFMAYRKLHQNVASFAAYTSAQAAALKTFAGLETIEAAQETIMAKMVGRWRSGIPLEIAPDYAQAKALENQWRDVIQLNGKPCNPAEAARVAAYEKLIMDFRYRADMDGARCPLTAHIRRVNPRDALSPLPAAPDTALTNRRRLLRRGAPYGDSTTADDDGEHGVIFMALCASLFNQFEFVQQQWVHYGASFGAGNDTDPLTGLRRAGAKFVIPADPAKSTPPFFCANMPQFVETRGGEYFFLPSLTALRQIAQGSVDPT